MSAQDIRLNIDKILDNTQDKDLLETYLSLLKTLAGFKSRQVTGYDMEGNSISVEELEQQAEEAVGRVRAGNFIRHHDLMKEVENW
jgi:hypothetical protein